MPTGMTGRRGWWYGFHLRSVGFVTDKAPGLRAAAYRGLPLARICDEKCGLAGCCSRIEPAKSLEEKSYETRGDVKSGSCATRTFGHDRHRSGATGVVWPWTAREVTGHCCWSSMILGRARPAAAPNWCMAACAIWNRAGLAGHWRRLKNAAFAPDAPHLVSELPFVVPNYSWWEGPFYGIGLKLYQAMAGKYGFGPSELLSKEELSNASQTSTRTAARRGDLLRRQFDDAAPADRSGDNRGRTRRDPAQLYAVTDSRKTRRVCWTAWWRATSRAAKNLH